MARIRTIKPEFWTSEKIVECSRDARLLFIGLWNFCDDGGIHPDSVKRIKMEVFPGDFDVDATSIRRMIDELESNRLIVRYTVEKQNLIAITGWKEHQKIDRPTYRYPQPPGDLEPNPPDPLDERSTSDHPRKGREGKDKPAFDEDSSSTEETSEFENFWSAYPRKVDKRKAETAFNRLTKTNQQAAITDIASGRFDGTDQKFIPHPTTYIHGERWNDEQASSPNAPTEQYVGHEV